MDETAAPPPTTVAVFGLPFHNVTFSETVEWARRRVASGQPGYIATVNMDFVAQAWRDPEFQRILFNADLVVADGIPIVWLSGLLGPRLKERVTGSDLVPMLAEMARDNNFSLFHLGGAPGVAEKAADALTRRFPGLRMAGCYSPPYAGVLDMDHAGILARLEAAKPDLLLIAFGAPKQEKFANMHVHHWHVPVSIGIGGSLDFLAGAQKRAPKIVQQLAMEWFWRMLSDPPRLFRRYVGNLTLFFQAMLQLTLIRCRPDRAVPPFAPAPELVRAAHVEAYVRFSDAAQAAAFGSALQARATGRPIVLDLSGVPWVSSLELGALLRLTTQLHQRQQPCILAGVGLRIRRLLAWSRLSEYLELGNSPGEILGQIQEWAACPPNGSVQYAAAGQLVLQLPRELTEANVVAFQQLVATAPVREGTREWLVEASFTRHVDSAALGCLLALQKQAAARGIALRFTGVRPAVHQALHNAKMAAVLLTPETTNVDMQPTVGAPTTEPR